MLLQKLRSKMKIPTSCWMGWVPHQKEMFRSLICLICMSISINSYMPYKYMFEQYVPDPSWHLSYCRNTGSKERIWQSDKEKYYETVVALMSDKTDGELPLEKLKILTSKESKTENTQYYLQIWPEKKQVQITDFPHPYPQLASLYKEMIRYQRKDGVQLTATLYLPPGYDPSQDGPLPCLVWSYPGEFKSKDAAGQVRGSPNEFPGIGATSPLLWLARGYYFSFYSRICIPHFLLLFLKDNIFFSPSNCWCIYHKIIIFCFCCVLSLNKSSLPLPGLLFYQVQPSRLLEKAMKRPMTGLFFILNSILLWLETSNLCYSCTMVFIILVLQTTL